VAVVCLSITDEKKYLQEISLRQLEVVEIQHAGEHRECRIFWLQQILRILAQCCGFSVVNGRAL